MPRLYHANEAVTRDQFDQLLSLVEFYPVSRKEMEDSAAS